MIGLYFPDSHMWGGLVLHFFRELEIEFEVIDNTKFDKLKDIKVLIVPGGFASQKARTLKDRGIQTLREYVKTGGIYIGICGGAGLALNHGELNLGLCPFGRKDMSLRVPNFSGHVWVDLDPDQFLDDSYIEHKGQMPVWWPSQFDWIPSNNVKVLARYKAPAEDLWIADIPYNILEKMDISYVEEVYGINLNFELLVSEPCILIGDYFKGRFLLSYPHLETPASEFANRFFVHILSDFLQDQIEYREIKELDLKDPKIKWGDKDLIYVKNSLLELIDKAQENFLVCWRKKWLIGWRRGVIGLCLNSLLCMCSLLLEFPPTESAKKFWRGIKKDFLAQFNKFIQSFEEYIILQRQFFLKNPQRPPDKFGSSKIHNLLLKLTGPFPGDGGLFKELYCYLEKLTLAFF